MNDNDARVAAIMGVAEGAAIPPYSESHDQINAAIAEWARDNEICIRFIHLALLDILRVPPQKPVTTVAFALATPLQKTLALLAAFDALKEARNE